MRGLKKNQPLAIRFHPDFKLPLQTSLQRFYLQEVCVNLSKIEKAVARWRRTPKDTACLQKMKTAARAVLDLAIIHGYDGVENMSRRLVQTLEHLVRYRERYSATVAAKLKSAALAIRQVAGLEAENEHQMTVETVNRQVQAAEKEVQSRTEKLAQSFAPIVRIESPLSDGTTQPPAFDIREDQTLFDLADLAPPPF